MSKQPLGFNASFKLNGNMLGANAGIDARIPASLALPPLWPLSANNGYFSSDELAAELHTAIAANENWIVWLAFKRADSSGTSNLATFGKTTATEGRIQHYMSGVADSNIFIKTSAGSNAVFKAWGNGTVELDYILYQHVFGGVNYNANFYTASGYKGASVPYAGIGIDVGLDTMSWGALKRNGGVEIAHTGHLLGCGFARGASMTLSGAEIDVIEAEWTGEVDGRVNGVITRLQQYLGSDLKMASSLKQGATAAVGTTPVEGGTFTTYEEISV